MSRLRANQITNENANGAPNFPHGITVTGIVTASTASTTMDQIVVGSAVTANSQGIDVTGIVTATSFKGDGTNLTGVSGPEVYGFTGIGSNLQVTTTNRGADNITGAQYDAFEQVLFAPSGMTFSINSDGNLIATI